MTQLYVMCRVSDTETMFSVWITAYEAHTLRRLGMSRCWTRAGVWQRHMLHIWLHWITSIFSNYYWRQHVIVHVVFVSVLIMERKKLQLQQSQTVTRLSLALLLQNQTWHQVHSFSRNRRCNRRKRLRSLSWESCHWRGSARADTCGSRSCNCIRDKQQLI